MSNEQNFRSYYALNPRIIDLIEITVEFYYSTVISVISVLILVCELHPTALSVYRIGRRRCSFLLKSSLL